MHFMIRAYLNILMEGSKYITKKPNLLKLDYDILADFLADMCLFL
jgi:hypothetical protein